MKRALTALVLIPLVLALVFWGPLWAVAVVAYFFTVVAVREYLDIVEMYGIQPLRKTTWVVVGTIGASLIAASSGSEDALVLLTGVVLLTPFVMLLAVFAREPLRSAIPSAAASLLGIAWIVIPMLLLVALVALPHGRFYVLFLLVVVWSGDIFAYYVGRAIGKHRMAPRISPKKSWEGAIASVVGSASVGVVLIHFAPDLWNALEGWGLISQRAVDGLPNLFGAAIGAVSINAAAQVGDLAESLLKRGAGVKDSGTVLPGHGGVLDRIDALLFAAPVAVVAVIAWTWNS